MNISPAVFLGKSVVATVTCQISPGYPAASLKLSTSPDISLIDKDIIIEQAVNATSGWIRVVGAGSRNESYICTAEQVFPTATDGEAIPPENFVIKKKIFPKIPGESFKSVLSCIDI